MSYLNITEKPDVKLKYLIMAFAGWADAGEAATNTVKFIRRSLSARKFAEIDPEEFYDFTQTRPYSVRTKDGLRRVNWPANEFFWAVLPGTNDGVMFYLGVEPNLRWRTFSGTIAGLAKDHGVETVVHLGALLDAVPHSRDVRLTGTATGPELRELLEEFGIQSSNYQGPTGISSAVLEACSKQDMGYATLWGHTSHYLQAAPNYRVSYTLTQTLAKFLNLPLDLSELNSAAVLFDEEVAKAIAEDEQISSYVSKLETQYDQAAPAGEIPDPKDMVKDLEQFLRSRQRRRPGDPPSLD
jgi:predicted ATP-grasp superfamily ATP-dependent carboligase